MTLDAAPRAWWRAITAAAPDAAIAVWFALTWLDPLRFGERALRSGVLTMLMEFIVVHSSGFLAVIGFSDEIKRVRRMLAIVGLGLFYTMFVGAFAWEFHTWAPVLGFWALIGNRLLGVLVGSPARGREKAYVMGGWAVSVALYLLGVGVTAGDWVPRLGVTPEIVAAQGFTSGGLWTEQPHHVLAFGVVYFAGVALWQLIAHRLLGTAKN